MKPSELAQAIESAGLAAGLDVVGFAGTEPFHATRVDLEERKAAGLAAGMQFTYRNPARSTEPDRIMSDARSLVVGARSYVTADAPPPTEVSARVARYARQDHYAALGESLAVVADLLVDAGWTARVVLDDNALVDRAAAFRAGLGWFGKNSNLLLPGRGSWFVIGSVLTNAPLPPSEPVGEGCGSCTACVAGCPTDAIIAPGVIDARRCLAWLVQAPGDIPVEYREAMGDRLYGCDDCQDVCPPNRQPGRAVAGDTSTGPDADADDEAGPHTGEWVAVRDVLESTDEVLVERFGRWYIPQRDPRHLRRNALVVVGNAQELDGEQAADLLSPYLSTDDSMLRRHAIWAARRHGLDRLLPDPGEEPDAEIRRERRSPVSALH